MNVLIGGAILSSEQLAAVTSNMKNMANEMDCQISIKFVDLRVNIGKDEPQSIDDLYDDVIADPEEGFETNV